MCWYCYWGWPKQVRQIYDNLVSEVGEDAANYGYAHIVWADENFEEDHVRYCIARCREARHSDPHYEAAEATLYSLEQLLALPKHVREPMPDSKDYDADAHPENYPPPDGLEMTHGT